MKARLKSLIIIGCATILYGIYYWGIPAVVDLPNRVEQLEKHAKTQGYNIKLENPHLKMGLLPAVELSADDFKLLNDDNSTAFELQAPYVKVNLLPLVIKKVDIENFSSKQLYAQLVYDKTLKLGQYMLPTDVKPIFTLKNAKAQLEGYQFDFSDLTTNQNHVLSGQYFALDSFMPDKGLKMSTSAALETTHKQSSFSVDLEVPLPLNKISEENVKLEGQIINLDLHDFAAYAKFFSKGKITDLSGMINASANTETSSEKKEITTVAEIKNLGIYTNNKDADIICKDKLVVHSRVGARNNALTINSTDVNTKNVHSHISGTISKLTSKSPTLNLDVEIKNSQIKNLVELLPGEEHLVPEINLLKLKQTPADGILSGKINIQGKADTPDVKGKMLAQEVYLVQPIPNAKKATVDLDFTGQKVVIDVHVPTAPMQYVDVKGPINLYNDRYAELEITSTPNIDFETAQRVLNPLHDILTFQIGPVPIMKLYGHGNIDLFVKGTKKQPHAQGKFNFYDTTASFIDIHNLTLKNGEGSLTFDDEDTHFITKKAFLNEKPLVVDGTCSMQGVLDFKVSANNQKTDDMLKIIQTSPMLKDIQQMTYPLEIVQGSANVFVNVTGKVLDPRDIVFNKNIFAKGHIDLLADKIKLRNLPLMQEKVSGRAEFENTLVKLNLTSFINQSKMKISGTLKENHGDIKISSDKFIIGDILRAIPTPEIPFKEDLAAIHTSFTSHYNGALNPINYNKISMKGKIYPSSGKNLQVNSGSFELHNGTFKLFPLTGMVKGGSYKTAATINNALTKPNINGEFSLKNFDIKNLNEKDFQEFLPEQVKAQVANFTNLEGIINFSSKISNNNIRAFTKLKEIGATYAPTQVKLKISSGHLLLNNGTLAINKLNSQFGQMPLFIDGKINKVLSKTPDLNIYVNAKPTQEFFDRFFNNHALYPIKLKGDIFLTSKITGTLDKIRTKSTLKIDENSSLYYMGASIGDNQNAVNISVDSTLTPFDINIHNLQYDKIINSQNNKPFTTPQLKVSGAITYLPDNNAAFNNLRIKTLAPTDAKIFNIIFRKPIMKQGVFTSDLNINGTAFTPQIRGNMEINSVDIPFFDSTIKDINLNFTPDKINIKSRGTILTNTIKIDAIAQNRLTPPYVIENVNVKLDDLDINRLTTTLRDMEADLLKTQTGLTTAQNVDLSQLILKNATITANTINVRNINANDLVAHLSLNDKMLLDVSDFRFKLAEGTVIGSFKQNLLTHATNLKLNLNRANAQIMTEALFDLKGQIYGSMTGEADLVCNGSSYEKCMQTLSGNGAFSVENGKMPKLGSLEYLLKAGNLIKGGIGGLSINSIIDFITPLKTGEFNSISGNIKISDGLIAPINIYSDGKDLNIYITGSYNLVNLLADMQVFGSLSKNITSVFGKIKNASLNTLLNTIPGVNLNEEHKEFQEEIRKIPESTNSSISRLFYAEIYGDINGDNYVKSFRWIK